MTLLELNERRIECAEYVRALGWQNAYGEDAEKSLAQSARYHLAHDAWLRAEADYQKALAETPTEQLIELAKG